MDERARTGDRPQAPRRAGAETSDVWNGYMDGAVRSGGRSAAEILASTS